MVNGLHVLKLAALNNTDKNYEVFLLFLLIPNPFLPHSGLRTKPTADRRIQTSIMSRVLPGFFAVGAIVSGTMQAQNSEVGVLNVSKNIVVAPALYQNEPIYRKSSRLTGPSQKFSHRYTLPCPQACRTK